MYLQASDNDVYIVAEVSANHAGSLELVLALAEAAKAAGADCLKLQTYTPDSLTVPCDNANFRITSGPWAGLNLYELYSIAAMPYEWQPRIMEHCYRIGLGFLSTPFDEEAADFLEELGISAFKIASFELVHIPLLRHIARKGKPMVLSCGMARPEEIGEALAAILEEGLSRDNIILLKCTSSYPSAEEDMHLATIPDMRRRYGCRVGLSDHSLGIAAPIAAVALGACFIEKHICLSRLLPSPDSSFSMEPHEFSGMVNGVRSAAKMRGHVTYGTANEMPALRRSIFITQDIQKGTILSHKNTRCIRPGHGLHPRYLHEVLGLRINTAATKGTPLSWEMLEPNP